MTKWVTAPECGEQAERVTEEGSGQRDDGERRARDQTEKQNKETGNVIESTEDGIDSGEGEDKTKWGGRVETTSEEADDEERMEQEEDGKEGRTEEERGVMREATLRQSDDRREKGRETSLQRMQTTAQRLNAKRKAEKNKDRI